MPISRIESGVAPAKSKLRLVGDIYTTTINSGLFELNTYTPPIGKIWEITQLYLKANPLPGGASGTHNFKLKTGAGYGLTGVSIFSSELVWDYNMWVVADSYQRPSTETASVLALRSLVYDNDNPLKIDYYNNTDVNQTVQRLIFAQVKETPII